MYKCILLAACFAQTSQFIFIQLVVVILVMVVVAVVRYDDEDVDDIHIVHYINVYIETTLVLLEYDKCTYADFAFGF